MCHPITRTPWYHLSMPPALILSLSLFVTLSLFFSLSVWSRSETSAQNQAFTFIARGVSNAPEHAHGLDSLACVSIRVEQHRTSSETSCCLELPCVRGKHCRIRWLRSPVVASDFFVVDPEATAAGNSDLFLHQTSPR